MAPWGSVSIEASTLDRSEEGEALVKDGKESAACFSVKPCSRFNCVMQIGFDGRPSCAPTARWRRKRTSLPAVAAAPEETVNHLKRF
jgi:hypothetical protein